MWNKYPTAKWVGVRNNAHEELFKLLDDVEPEVRAAAVFALGTFVGNVIERTDHANHVDHSVAHKLIQLAQVDIMFGGRYILVEIMVKGYKYK